ncbi:hypothetical protein [Gluconacetobacter entanii]|uniref:hypothetical protein n=1 Tax=Gluconacetobacter entanii TaxID=108528 RepID=UPI0011B46DDE|nr:hypothetical protein [Gluconacetobacter entanii]
MSSGGYKPKWTPEEDAVLIANYRLPETELRNLFPSRQSSGIRHRISALRKVGTIPAGTKRNNAINWDEQLPVVIRMHRAGHTFRAIAAIVGCSADAISNKMRMRAICDDNPKPTRIRRSCLRCTKSFTAQGRFNRLCDDCGAQARSCAFA